MHSSTILSLTLNVLRLLAVFLSTRLLLESLGVHDYGVLAGIQAAVTPIYYLATLGFEHVFLRRLRRTGSLPSPGPYLKFGISVVIRIGVGLVVILCLATWNFGDAPLFLTFGMGVHAVVWASSSLFAHLQRARGDVFCVIVREQLVFPISVLFVLLLLRYYELLDIHTVAAAYLVGGLGSVLWAILRAQQGEYSGGEDVEQNFDRATFKEELTQTTPLALATALESLILLQCSLVSWMVIGGSETAPLSVATKIAGIATVLSIITFPFVVESIRIRFLSRGYQSDRKVDYYPALSMLLSLSIVAVSYLSSKWLAHLFLIPTEMVSDFRGCVTLLTAGVLTDFIAGDARATMLVTEQTWRYLLLLLTSLAAGSLLMLACPGDLGATRFALGGLISYQVLNIGRTALAKDLPLVLRMKTGAAVVATALISLYLVYLL